MPYPKSLQAFTPAAFYHEAPASWVARLREISPITETLSHLRFRWWAPDESWNFSERGVWTLYACTPRRMVHPDRAEQFALHWSELHESQRAGRKAMVSDYQHFLWHTQGVEAMPFWILQGEWGGTPAKYSRREIRYLDASSAISDPFPLGFFPACPFDGRAVRLITQRDRLIQVCNQYDALEKMDRPAALKAEDDASERLFRETYLDTWAEIMRPSVEFMQSTLGRAHLEALPPAPEGTANAISGWKDHWIETGVVIGSAVAKSTSLQVAVQ